MMLDHLRDMLAKVPPQELFWLGLGGLGQLIFFMRFFVQWVASERQGRSVIPLAFWYFSLGGAAILLVYSIYRLDPVFIIGQGGGFFIYLRNLYLIRREKRAAAA